MVTYKFSFFFNLVEKIRLQLKKFLSVAKMASTVYETEICSAELAIIISYPTSASGIIVLLKTPLKYRKLDYNRNKKAKKITHTLAIFVDHGIMAYIP